MPIHGSLAPEIYAAELIACRLEQVTVADYVSGVNFLVWFPSEIYRLHVCFVTKNELEE